MNVPETKGRAFTSAATARAPLVCRRVAAPAETRMSALTMRRSLNFQVTMPEPLAASRMSPSAAGGSTWAMRSSRARCQARCRRQPCCSARS